VSIGLATSCSVLLLGRPRVRLLKVESCLIDRALRIIVGLDGQAVLSHGAIPLTGQIKDFPKLDVAPNLGPAWLVIAPKGIAIAVDGRLVVALRSRQEDRPAPQAVGL